MSSGVWFDSMVSTIYDNIHHRNVGLEISHISVITYKYQNKSTETAAA